MTFKIPTRRTSTGINVFKKNSSSRAKELTDINKQVDGFLRLSYHDFRTKDKDFNAAMKTDYDLSEGNVIVVPQEIGRVLLNLFNNAFYAVNGNEEATGMNLLCP